MFDKNPNTYLSKDPGLQHVGHVEYRAVLPCVQMGLDNAHVRVLHRHAVAGKIHHPAALAHVELVQAGFCRLLLLVGGSCCCKLSAEYCE